MIIASVRGPDLTAVILAANTHIETNAETALDTVAAATEGDGKAGCPVRTGALRDDIKTYKARLLRQIGNNLYYSIFVHNGTYKMRGRPYLLNSFNKNASGFTADIQALGV